MSNYIEYNTYLQSPHWKQIKEKTYTHRKSCAVCKSIRYLNIHHRRYKTNNGRSVLYKEQPRHLIVLCNRCHFHWHNKHQKQKLMKHHLFRIKYLTNSGTPPLKAIELCTSVNKCNEYLARNNLEQMPFKRKDLFKLFKSSGSA